MVTVPPWHWRCHPPNCSSRSCEMKGIHSGKGKDEYRYSQPPSAGHGPWYCAHRKIWRLLICFSYLILFLILFVYVCRDGMAWFSKPHPQSCFKATPHSATLWTPPTCRWEKSVSGMAGTFLCVCSQSEPPHLPCHKPCRITFGYRGKSIAYKQRESGNQELIKRKVIIDSLIKSGLLNTGCSAHAQRWQVKDWEWWKKRKIDICTHQQTAPSTSMYLFNVIDGLLFTVEKFQLTMLLAERNFPYVPSSACPLPNTKYI